jgi:hypothetical protein
LCLENPESFNNNEYFFLKMFNLKKNVHLPQEEHNPSSNRSVLVHRIGRERNIRYC